MLICFVFSCPPSFVHLCVHMGMWPRLRTGRHRVSQIFLARRACYLMMTNEKKKTTTTRVTQNLLVKVQWELGVQQVWVFGRQSRNSSESAAAAAAVVEWCTLRPALPSAPRTAPACPDTFHRNNANDCHNQAVPGDAGAQTGTR